MSSGLAVLPILCSNSIFSTRRTRNGADALSNGNPYVSLMNIDIAGGQVLKAADAVTSLAKDSNSIFANGIKCAEQSVRTLSQTDKIVSGIGKVLNFTANNINPIICATGAMKVATADDKKNAAIEESIALGTMFAFEGGAKKILGMPKTIKFDATNMTIENDGLYKIVNGTKELLAHNNKFKFIDNNKVIINNDGVYKSNPFIDKQITALTDFCNATKCCNISLKYLPGIAKGLAFVCASILGYKAGLCLSKTIIGDNRGNN